MTLKLFLYGFGSFISVYKFGVKLLVKGNVYMDINFLNHKLFENHYMHLLFVFALPRD